jgi:hypothetical protein
LIVPFVHICDYASVSLEGKLSVMGIFNRILATAVPIVHGMMYLAFEVELNYAEGNRPFKIEFQLVDADGNKLVGAESSGLAQGTFKIGDKPHFPQVIGLGGLIFPKLGVYSFNIFLNGELKGQAAFDVVPAPADGAAGKKPGGGGLPR